MNLRSYTLWLTAMVMLLMQLLPPSLHSHIAVSGRGVPHIGVATHMHSEVELAGGHVNDDAGHRGSSFPGQDATFYAERTTIVQVGTNRDEHTADGFAVALAHVLMERRAQRPSPPAIFPPPSMPGGAGTLAFDALAPPQANG